MRVGFKGFYKPRNIDADTKTALIDNVPDGLFILYTGGNYGRRKASGRSAALATVSERNKPVALKEYARRAADKGFPTSISIGGLRLHQGAKPAVYLLLEADDKGNLRAVSDIPVPDPAFSAKPFSRGDIVVPAKATKK